MYVCTYVCFFLIIYFIIYICIYKLSKSVQVTHVGIVLGNISTYDLNSQVVPRKNSAKGCSEFDSKFKLQIMRIKNVEKNKGR